MRLLLIFLCWFISGCMGPNSDIKTETPVKQHNRIDDIRVASDVENLLESVNPKYARFTVSETFASIDEKCRDFAKSIGAKPWTKNDFDGNGYTDLLVIGNYYGVEPIVIIDKGGNDFVANKIKIDFASECSLAVVSRGSSQTIVSYFDDNNPSSPLSLVHKYGGFIEVNQSRNSLDIEQIEFETTGCYGTCPSFRLYIGNDRRALFHPFEYNNKKEGDYRAEIEEERYQELIGLLNYIDFPSLKDEYFVDWTDLQRAFLTITYDGGKTKKIEDYGLMGTHGLHRLYEVLFDLRENQDWVPAGSVERPKE